ncbi:hypothetical protein [Rhizobium mesoamericanum]|uniref:hypothetical protein n=1 Tax=Rhizobium mesoamericanum TaxID=1079800 RepID=UPI00041F14DB
MGTAIPKREYYVSSPDGRRLFDMSLGLVTLSFVGAPGKADLARIRALSSTYGSEWPAQWLTERGINRYE